MTHHALPDDFRVLHQDRSQMLMAEWRGVFITVWTAVATASAIRTIAAQTDALRARHPEGWVSLAIVPTAVGNPPQEVRHEAEQALARAADRTRAMAYVFEGTGFGAATTRALVAGIMLVQRSRLQSKVFDAVRPAAEWVLPHRTGAPRPVDAAALADAVAHLRAS